MKIALISELNNPVAPDFTGGVEVLNYNLANELSRRGEDITLFASADSSTEAKMFPACPKSLFHGELDPNDPSELKKIMDMETRYFIQVIEYIKNNQFDIIHHSHSSFLPIYLGTLIKVPQIMTCHFIYESTTDLKNSLEQVLPNQEKIGLIAISQRQRKLLDKLRFIETVYNGVNLNDFSFSPTATNDNFIWLGRIAPNKGTEEAIKIATESKVNLIIAGERGIGIKANEYFDKIEKECFANRFVSYVGRADRKKRNNLLGEAKAFIFPVQWEEPFGLVTVEAMACGTPVIAFQRGAVPEIIKDGETGFICPPDDVDCMVRSVKKIEEMPDDQYLEMRKNCRKQVEKNFTVEKMVDDYRRIYQEVIADWRKHE